MLNGIRHIQLNHPRVFQIFACNFTANFANPAQQAFNPEEIVRWICTRHGNEKSPVATTKVNLDRAISREYFLEVQPLDQRIWNVFD